MAGQCCDCPKASHVPNTYEEGISDPLPVICTRCIVYGDPGYEHDYVPKRRRHRSLRASARLIDA